MVMTSWLRRIARPDRKNTETLQFAFLHSLDGHPLCGVIPLIVGESEDTAKATCDELAAYGGGALVRQDARLPYTTIQAALDEAFPHNGNYWDKGVFVNWDPSDDKAVQAIVDIAISTWNKKSEFASKMRRVFPEETMQRLRNLKKKHDPEGMFKTGAWQYEANT